MGKRIRDVEIYNRALREPVKVPTLRRRCVGRHVLAVGRRAKYLLIGLEGDFTLVVHLGMSGRLTVSGGSPPLEPHEHLRFALSSRRLLRFRDPRRFGLVLALATARLERDRHFAHLGREPLEPGFDGAVLRRLASGRRAPIKSFLMDARIVVGIGNIYATEALFRAGIHPGRAAGRISRDRLDRLAVSVRAVLEQAIAEGGTTLNDFRGAGGDEGYFQVSLAVYGRESAPCPSCTRPIRRMVQSGRSTFYCPRCQT